MPALATGFQFPLASFTLTQDYGKAGALKNLPTYKHLGEDYAAPLNSPILAAANGKVVAASYNDSFGNYVVVEHTLPNLTKVYSLYAHMSSISVALNQDVFIGQKVGVIGKTGAADGVHLHFEISYVNKFTQSAMYGNGYDSPAEFTTSSKYTVDPGNFIKANPVTNQQSGSSQSDTLWGQNFAETFFGNNGNDVIYGNGGNDVLVGGLGSDVLFGGSGADRFVFQHVSESTSAVRDRIQDFNRFEGDKIDLRAIDANVNPWALGDQSFNYIGGSNFSGFAGQLRFSNGSLSADINGDKVADLVINVLGTSSFTSNDFLL